MNRLTVFLLCTILIVGCTEGKQEKEVERVAYGYLEAMGNYRINDAGEFSSSATRETTIPIFNRMMKVCDSAKLMENTPAEITVTGVSILNDTTAVAYYHKHTPIKEQDDSVSVVKEDGRWLVDVRVQEPGILKFLEDHTAVTKETDTVGK